MYDNDRLQDVASNKYSVDELDDNNLEADFMQVMTALRQENLNEVFLTLLVMLKTLGSIWLPLWKIENVIC